MQKLDSDFFMQDAYVVAPKLLGKYICRDIDGEVKRFLITETECYVGVDDTACHAHKGKTPRTSVMWQEGGVCYIYLCYGMHQMLNFVTGEKDVPQAVLIRGIKDYQGPGKLTKAMAIDARLNGEDLTKSSRIWVEEDRKIPIKFTEGKRVGIGYAQKKDQDRLWRFTLVES